MDDIRTTVDAVYRAESRRVLATLIRLLGDFDVAEEALHEAFRAAIEQWPRDGVPANPRAWLVSTGRFKAIDRIRKGRRMDSLDDEQAEQLPAETQDLAAMLDEDLEDDRLRLIFTCCHPALPPDARVALTLREVCDLTTEEIARAFLTAPSTLAQRIVRAKNKIKVARIPYVVPSRAQLPERLDAVLRVIYLVFNEGYAASSGSSLTRHDLSAEAIRVGRLLVELLPEPEALGLLALMLLHESRRAARTTPDRRARAARRAGSLALGSRVDRRGHGTVAACARDAEFRCLHAAGRDLERARGCCDRSRHGLGRDRRLVRRAAQARADARRRAQPRRRRRDARRARRWPRARRRVARARRARRLSSRARCACGLVPPSWARPAMRARRTSVRSS